MRLYRFIDTDKKIDVVVVTDGSCEQKEFLSLNLRVALFLLVLSILLLMKKQEVMLFLALGWKWNVGESVQHEELVAFAENNALTLTVEPQGLNEIVAVNAEWNDENACVLSVYTTVPAEKEIEIYFPNSVKLNNSIGRYGVIRGDRKVLTSKVNGRTPMEFTLADLGLDAKEDLNLVVMADAGVQKFEVVAKNS